MRPLRFHSHMIGIFLFLILLIITAVAQEFLVKELEPLQPFVQKTRKGEFVNSTAEAPKYDVSRCERALNGSAIWVLHSMNNGEYGGESIIFWDKNKQSVVYCYFTTAGFFTNGTMTFKNDTIISHEYVTGNTNGITEVQSISIILPDGRLHGKSQYLQNCTWTDGHEIIYIEDLRAEVIFK